MFHRILLILLFSISFEAFSEEKISDADKRSAELIDSIFDDFEAANYEKVIDTLTSVEANSVGLKENTKYMGLVYYWKGMSYARLSDYEFAEKFFRKALQVKFTTKDIYYEYGQVLYVIEDYKKARVAFKKSFKQGYKRGVSLYYIAFISQELKDDKKAVNFYKMVEKLPEDEKKDVLQAARMQIADIYLKKIEKLPDSFKDVEKYVIPQYKKALSFNEETPLAEQIKIKIEELQRKYELVLFRMRNGRLTSRPPYYLRANVLYGIDNNVTALSETAKEDLDENQYASHYMTTGVFGRYSFYPNSIFSYAPEINARMTKYSETTDEIKVLNNYSINTSLNINYEHIYNEAAATFFIDLDYTYNADYADGDDVGSTFTHSDSVYGITLSEELQLITGKPSIFRFSYSKTVGVEETDSLTSMGFNYEQIVPIGRTTLYFLNSYTMSEYVEEDSEGLNTNTLFSRIDMIFPTFMGLFNPTFYASYNNADYVEDADTDFKTTTTYGINLNRPLSKNFYLTMDLSQASTVTKETDDNYEQQVMTFNIDYIY